MTMKLVDIKSRETTPLTINLRARDVGITPALGGQRVVRTVERKDPTTGELRLKNVEVTCPPVLRWPAGGTIKGLPAQVLSHPIIQSKMARTGGRRPTLVVVNTSTTTPSLRPSPKARSSQKSRSRSTGSQRGK